MMNASSEIRLMKEEKGREYENPDRYQRGFEDAKDKASEVAHKYDMVMARMAGALEEICLEDPEVVQALGISASFNVGTALRVYRNLVELQNPEGVK